MDIVTTGLVKVAGTLVQTPPRWALLMSRSNNMDYGHRLQGLQLPWGCWLCHVGQMPVICFTGKLVCTSAPLHSNTCV